MMLACDKSVSFFYPLKVASAPAMVRPTNKNIHPPAINCRRMDMITLFLTSPFKIEARRFYSTPRGQNVSYFSIINPLNAVG